MPGRKCVNLPDNDDLTAEFEHQLETLKSKITLLETLIETERERTRNLEEERDVAIKDMVRAQNEAHGIKSENKALKTEVANLRKQLHNTNNVPAPKTSTAKERVKELVEAERKRDQSHKSHAQRDPRVERESFIRVSIRLTELISSPTKLRNCEKKSNLFEMPKVRAVLIKKRRRRKVVLLRLSTRLQRMLKETFRYNRLEQA